MILHIELESHTNLERVREFLTGKATGIVLIPDRKEAYEHIKRVLRRFSYWRLGKADKGLLRCYLLRTTGLSRAQLARLVARYLADGELRDRRRGAAWPFRRRYERSDILLLAETDELHGTLAGPTTRKILERAWTVFRDVRFERLAGLSNGHLYNLRHSQASRRRRGEKVVTRPVKVAIGERRRPRRRGEKVVTRPVKVAIGERRRPRPEGRAGYLRVDSVHQGDLAKVKGVYHINVMDEVTQYEFVGTVERISERYLIPVLEGLLGAFPFQIRGFHSDHGS